MNSSDDRQDHELLARYRAASDAEPLAPRDAVRAAILEEGRRVAALVSNTTERQPRRWKLTAFATAATVLLAALVIAPKLIEHEQQSASTVPASNAFKQAAVRKPQPEAQSYASTPPVPVMPVQGAPAAPPRLEDIQPQTSIPARARNVEPPPPIHYPEQSVEVSMLNKRQVTAEALPAPPPATANAAAAPTAGASRAFDSAASAENLPKATSLSDRRAAAIAQFGSPSRTPLTLAVERGQLDVVKSLLKQGADANAADRTGVTPLQLAEQKGFSEIAGVLKEAGAK